MSVRLLLRLALGAVALVSWPLVAQEGDDTPAPVLAMLESAAGLSATAPKLLDPNVSDAPLRLLAQTIPNQAAALQAGVVQLYALVRGAGAPPGRPPAMRESLAGRVASLVSDQSDVLSQVVQHASNLEAGRNELEALVANGRVADPAVQQSLSDLQAKLAELRSHLESLSGAATARTWRVPAGGDFQAALNSAQPGDTIVLTAGATYTGNFRLPVKPGSKWITVTTSQPQVLPPLGTRITAAQAAALPKIVTPNNMRALEADPGAHHYLLYGLEIAPAPGIYSLGLLALGQTDNTSPSGVPHDFNLEQLYVHGDPVVGGKYGIRLEAAQVTVADSTIRDIKSDFQDSQALTGCNGPGPFTVVNNHLEASGENVMWGSCGTLPGVIPSDIVMRGNYFFKPLSWRTEKWSVKNSFEIKNGQRIRLEGNVFENNWPSAQSGFMVQLTPRALTNLTPGVVRDITFVDNTFRNSSMGVNILGWDDNFNNAGEARSITFRDNLFSGFGDPTLNPKMFQLLGPVQTLTLDHNTMLLSNGAFLTADTPVPGVQITNSIFSHADYGFWGPTTVIDLPTIQKYLPASVVSRNVVIGGTASNLPPNNYTTIDVGDVGFLNLTTYQLRSDSRFVRLAADGTNPGINAAQVQRAALAAVSGVALQ